MVGDMARGGDNDSGNGWWLRGRGGDDDGGSDVAGSGEGGSGDMGVTRVVVVGDDAVGDG